MCRYINRRGSCTCTSPKKSKEREATKALADFFSSPIECVNSPKSHYSTIVVWPKSINAWQRHNTRGKHVLNIHIQPIQHIQCVNILLQILCVCVCLPAVCRFLIFFLSFSPEHKTNQPKKQKMAHFASYFFFNCIHNHFFFVCSETFGMNKANICLQIEQESNANKFEAKRFFDFYFVGNHEKTMLVALCLWKTQLLFCCFLWFQ